MNKVWTYVIGKHLSPQQLAELQALGEEFVKSWTAHEQKLAAGFEIYKERILIIRVNESVHNASGCSIDKLLRFIKEMEQRFHTEMLNRLLVTYQLNNTLEVVHATAVKELLEKQKLGPDTLVYNTAVASEDELSRWEQPLKETWLKKYLS